MLTRYTLRRFFSKQIRRINAPEITAERERDAKLSQTAMLRTQQARYMNKERQSRYHSTALASLSPGQTAQQSQKALNRRLLDAESIEKVLNIYDSNRFYLSNYQLLTALSQFLRLVPAYLKERKRVMLKGGKPKRYDQETDMRLSAIISQLDREKDNLTPSESVFASWVLAKGDKYLDSDYLSVQIIENLTENSLPLLSTKDLSVLIWSMAKTQSKKKKPLGRLAIEIETRFKKRMDLRQSLFSSDETETKIGQSEILDPHGEDEQPEDAEYDEYQDANEEIESKNPSFLKDNTKFRENMPFSTQSVCMYMWSLGKLNIIDTDLTGPIFDRMIEEGIVEKLSLLQIQMLVPSITSIDFECKEQLVNRLYWRLNSFIEVSSQQTQTDNYNKEDDPLGNQLALKTLLTQFPKLHKIIPCRKLYTDLLKAYFSADLNPSPRFLTEIVWSMGRMNLEKLPAKVCRQIEDSIAINTKRYTARDLSSCLYTLGVLIRRKDAKQISEVSFDVNMLVKLLVNEIAIKKEYLTKRENSMLSEVKPEITAHCSYAKTVIH